MRGCPPRPPLVLRLAAGAVLVAARRPTPAARCPGRCRSWTWPRAPACATHRSTAASSASASSSRRTAPGVAFLDYDNDGWLDALVLSGTRLATARARTRAWPRGPGPTNRLYRNQRRRDLRRRDRPRRPRRTGWASSVCAGDYDNDGAAGPVRHLLRPERPLPQPRRRALRGRDRARPASPRPARAGARAAASWTTTATAGSTSSSPTTWPSTSRPRRSPGRAPNCLWKGIAGELRAEGPAHRHEPPLPQRGRRHASRTCPSARAWRKRHRPLPDDAPPPPTSTATAWVDIYVACDSTAVDPLPQQPRRDLHGPAALASGVALQRVRERPGGDGPGGGRLRRATAGSTCLKTHFADDIPALYRNLGRGLFEDVGHRDRPRASGTATSSGARGCPTSTTTAGRTSSTSPATSIRRSSAHCRSTRTAGRASSSATAAARRFEDVTERSGPGATAPHSSRGAAFGDFDNDGDVDLLVMNMNEPPSLLRNDYAGGNGWLEVKLEGTRSNRDGPGGDRGGHRGRPQAGAGRAQPDELLLARRPAAALRPGGERARGDGRGALAERPGGRGPRRGRPPGARGSGGRGRPGDRGRRDALASRPRGPHCATPGEPRREGAGLLLRRHRLPDLEPLRARAAPPARGVRAARGRVPRRLH